MNPSSGRKPGIQLWASSNRACALLCALPTQTQENNHIWMLDSLISASAHAYTSSMTKTSEWSLMPAKHCFPQNASIQTAKKHCFALCGPSSISLITQKVIIETCHQPVTFLNSQRIRDGVVINAHIATWLIKLQGRDVEARYAQNYKSSVETGLRPAKTVQRTHCTPQQNRKNRHNRKWQITGSSRRMCVKECPQHMSMAAPIIARAIYKLEHGWPGSTTTHAHRNNSN